MCACCLVLGPSSEPGGCLGAKTREVEGTFPKALVPAPDPPPHTSPLRKYPNFFASFSPASVKLANYTHILFILIFLILS